MQHHGRATPSMRYCDLGSWQERPIFVRRIPGTSARSLRDQETRLFYRPYMALMDFDWVSIPALLCIFATVPSESRRQYGRIQPVLYLEKLHDHQCLWNFRTHSSRLHVQYEVSWASLHHGYWRSNHHDLFLRIHCCPHSRGKPRFCLRYQFLSQHLLWLPVCVHARGPAIRSPSYGQWYCGCLQSGHGYLVGRNCHCCEYGHECADIHLLGAFHRYGESSLDKLNPSTTC